MGEAPARTPTPTLETLREALALVPTMSSPRRTADAEPFEAPVSGGRKSKTGRMSLIGGAKAMMRGRSKSRATEDHSEAGWNKFSNKIRAMGKLAIAFRLDVPESSQVFTPYLPRMLHQQLLDYSVPAGLQLKFAGEGRSVKAAVMFSDASGFTQVRAAHTARTHAVHTTC